MAENFIMALVDMLLLAYYLYHAYSLLHSETVGMMLSELIHLCGSMVGFYF